MSDLIEREDAIKLFLERKNELAGIQGDLGGAMSGAAKLIESLPSAEKKGKWMKKPDPYGFFDEIPVCSQCGCTTKWREEYKYCPNCGAKMEVSE